MTSCDQLKKRLYELSHDLLACHNLLVCVWEHLNISNRCAYLIFLRLVEVGI